MSLITLQCIALKVFACLIFLVLLNLLKLTSRDFYGRDLMMVIFSCAFIGYFLDCFGSPNPSVAVKFWLCFAKDRQPPIQLPVLCAPGPPPPCSPRQPRLYKDPGCVIPELARDNYPISNEFLNKGLFAWKTKLQTIVSSQT